MQHPVRRILSAVTVSLCVGLCALMLSAPAHAERTSVRGSDEFAIPKGLEGRVEFWRLIFTKYGDNHRVFHHRLYPEVIYSVLDFAPFEKISNPKKSLQAREQAVENEIERIRNALTHLGKGNKPRTPFERRLVKLFENHVPERGTKKFRTAAEKELIRYQRGIKERFREGLVRSGRYLYAIEEIFRSEGLPPELGRLPLVESSFNYEAYSSVGAAGIWQFMPATGRKYMRVNSHIDERRDPVVSTRAAAQYLRYSYEKLGNWPLAVTSYNHGLSGVMRAAKESGSKDIVKIIRRYKAPSFGFASGNFYAEFLAAVDVERNSERYFPGLQREQPWRFDEVRLGRSIYFKEFARLVKVDIEDLKYYNRPLLRPVLANRVPIPAGTLVKVPRGGGARFARLVKGSSVLPAIEGTVVAARAPKVVGGQRYRVAPGDTIGGIASRFGVKQEELLAANSMRSADLLKVGDQLTLPSPETTAVAQSSDRGSATPAVIRVKGDLPAAQVPEPSAPAADEPAVEPLVEAADEEPASEQEEAAPAIYVVRKGDTIGAIARRTGVSQRELMQLNGIRNPRALKVGAKLKLASRAGSSRIVASRTGRTASLSAKRSAAARKTRETSYKVKKGDTVSRIAKRFSVSPSLLMSVNNIKDSRSLQIGQKLVIPRAD